MDEALTNSPILDPISEFKELLGNEFDPAEMQTLSPKYEKDYNYHSFVILDFSN